MILVDTSVWIEHLHVGRSPLGLLLDEGRALVHPMVIGELACGFIVNRDEILQRLSRMSAAPQASQHEVMGLLRRHQLFGLGLGWIDMHLLASARLSGAGLLTLDATLRRAAVKLQCSVVI